MEIYIKVGSFHITMAYKQPKIVKYVDDPCYAKKFKTLEDCVRCWIKKSCEANFKSRVKKEMLAKKNLPVKIREKKYKKTDKHRDW
jgi:hypothetical protein